MGRNRDELGAPFGDRVLPLGDHVLPLGDYVLPLGDRVFGRLDAV